MAGGWRVQWSETVDAVLAGPVPAVVVGNEFVDALPVHLVDVRGERPLEAWVELGPSAGEDAAVREVWDALSEDAEAELRALFGSTDGPDLRPLTRDGIIELRPATGILLRQLAAGSPAVCLLTIDYGEWFGEPGATPDAPSAESDAGLGRPATRLRSYGRTVRGYFRHQPVADPYERVGRQDLTADVDFRALDAHGRQSGFETVLFTTVAELLLADGGEERLEALRREALHPSSTTLDADHQATVLEALLDEQGLGGAFKVMLQVRE